MNTVYSFFLLAILAFGIMIAPAETRAEAYGTNTSDYYSSYDQNYNQNSYQNYYPNYYQMPVYVQAPTPAPTPTSTPTIYSNSANPNQISLNSAPKKIAKVKTTSKTNTTVAKAKTSADSNLSANAISGSDSFMPSGLMEWIVFSILVLLTVILVRKVYGGSEKYHATPMKHK